MKFNSIDKCLPKIGVQVLIKIKDECRDDDDPKYSICNVLTSNNHLIFLDADVMNSSGWDVEDVEAWMHINELDLIEVD